MSTTVHRGLLALSLLLVVWILAPFARDLVVQPEASRGLRGRDLALSLGCFACHGAEGRGGVANPGSRREAVPGFTGSTLMMYVHDEAEIRQYVLDGRPDRLADDPDYRAEMDAQAIHMPAYRGRVSDAELDLLVTYIRIVSGMIEPKDEQAKRGLEIAGNAGCFGCHGPLGIGGRDNPRSLKGYVPGFAGADFRELVRDDGELREWIREGRLERLERHPIGSWFTARQVIQMPSYKRFLKDDEIDALIALLHWIQGGGPEKDPMS